MLNSPLLLSVLAIPFSLYIIVKSADIFIEGSAQVARKFGISSFVIGAIIVGFGTSAPELVVSAFAAFEGKSGIALGNAYGSNITNIALILGVTALILPIRMPSMVLKREIPILGGITLLSGVLLIDHRMTRWDALVLLVVFAVVMAWTLLEEAKREQSNPASSLQEEVTLVEFSMQKASLKLFFGLLALLLSSRLFVWGAVNIASHLGVSELVIGLTIVAIGTSLPELATSIQSARKGEHDLALGNILGSNLFNTLAVIGIAAMVSPLQSSPEVLTRDLPIVFTLTLLLVIFNFWKKNPKTMGRWQGLFFLICFVGYVTILF